MKNSRSTGTSSRHVVYVGGNLSTSQLDDKDIEELVTTKCIAIQQQQQRRAEICSIRVYQDSVYIEFANESDAKEAAERSHGQIFRSFRLESYYLGRISKVSDLFTCNKRDVDEFLSKKQQQNANEKNKTRTTPVKRQQQQQHQRNHHGDVDCELIVLDRQLRKYAESINDKLKSSLFCFSTQIKYTRSETAHDSEIEDPKFVAQTLDDALSRNVLYLIFVDHTNEQYNSLTLFDLNSKWKKRHSAAAVAAEEAPQIKENRNMPLNRALDYLKSDFYNYLNYLKKFHHHHHHHQVTKDSDDFSNADNGGDDDKDDEDDDFEDESEIKPDKTNNSCKIFRFNKKQKKFLSLLLKPILCDDAAADATENVKLNDLDRLLTYLSRQKSNLIAATLTPPSSTSTTNEQQQQQNLHINHLPSLIDLQVQPPPPQQQPQQQQQQQQQQIPSLLNITYTAPPPPLLAAQTAAAAAFQFQMQAAANSLLGQYSSAPPLMSLIGAPPPLMNLSSQSNHHHHHQQQQQQSSKRYNNNN